METHHQPQKNKENDVQKKTEEGVVAKPPSPSSSPSHEFSFTISLHSTSNTTIQDKSKTPPSLAVDLSPADDIFFHGHLLPLHLFLSMFFGSLIPHKALLTSIQQRKDHNTTPFSLSLSLHQKEKIIK